MHTGHHTHFYTELGSFRPAFLRVSGRIIQPLRVAVTHNSQLSYLQHTPRPPAGVLARQRPGRAQALGGTPGVVAEAAHQQVGEEMRYSSCVQCMDYNCTLTWLGAPELR